MAVTARVALSNEILNLSLSQLRRNIFVKNSFYLLCWHHVPISFIKYTEALFRLLVTSGLVLSVADHVLAESKIYTVSLFEVRVTLSEFFINFSGVHFVESKVLKDISEVVGRDVASIIAIIEIKGFLEVRDHVARKVVDVWLRWLNASTILLLCFLVLFSRHF